jgi:glutamate formiminotransferase/formiminotetrahydrofolate cyclodeaminase
MRVAQLSLDAARLAKTIAEIGNKNAATDAATGALMARTAVQVAAINVKTNAVNLQNQELAAEWLTKLEQMEAEAAQIVESALATSAKRGGY